MSLGSKVESLQISPKSSRFAAGSPIMWDFIV